MVYHDVIRVRTVEQYLIAEITVQIREERLGTISYLNVDAVV